MRYLEDFTVGDTYELGSTTVDEESIVRFATEFDPQPFHLDAEAAEGSSFGGLVASGWHVASLFMRQFVDSMLLDTANLGGLGVDDMHWKVPVRPGDTLAARVTVEEARPSNSRPDRGVIGWRMEFENQRGEIVWYATTWSLALRRPE